MAHYLPSGLARYHGVILSLLPYSKHEKIHELVTKACKKHHPSSLPSVHQEIVMEIRKLARPCTRCIDLRTYFEDSKPYPYGQLTHYLDQTASETFQRGVEKNDGVFNLVLYHQIIENAKSRYSELMQSKQQVSERSTPKLAELPEVAEQPLVNTLFCKTPKLSHNSKLSWSTNDWTDDSLSIHRLEDNLAEISRFEQGRLRIQFRQKKPTSDTFCVYIYEHDPHIIDAWKTNLPLALCVTKTRARTTPHGENWDVQLNEKNTPETLALVAGYLQAKFRANHRLLHEQFDPLRSAILAKCHAQWWRAHSSQVGLLCGLTEKKWRATHRLYNERNQDLVRFVPEDITHWMERLVAHPEFQSQIEAAEKPTEHTLGLFLHQGRVWFETRAEKLYHASWRQAICAGQARLVKYRISTVHPLEMAHIPSALPDHVGGEFALLNQQPRKKVRMELASCLRAIYFDDISSIFSALPAISRPRFELHILSTASPLPDETTLPALKDVVVPKVELRLEDRFECALSVSIRSQKRPHLHSSGITENISVRGLRVRVHELPRWEPGEMLEIDMHIAFGTQVHALNKQPYQLIGHASDGICRLAFAGTNNPLHIADKLIQQYIYRNIEVLQPNSSEREHTPGLGVAVRNILTACLPETTFFMQQGKHGFSLRAAETSTLRQQLSYHQERDHGSHILSSLIQDKVQRSKIIQQINKLSSTSAEPLLVILLPQSSALEPFAVYDAEQLKTQPSFEAQIEQCRRNGNVPIVLKVSTSMTTPLVQKEFFDELSRLRRIHVEHAQMIDHVIETTRGIGSVQDVSAVFWRWFDTIRGRSLSAAMVGTAA